MDLNTSLTALNTNSEFTGRHIGPTAAEQQEMLSALGFSNFDELMTKVVPKTIFSREKLNVGDGISNQNRDH